MLNETLEDRVQNLQYFSSTKSLKSRYMASLTEEDRIFYEDYNSSEFTNKSYESYEGVMLLSHI